MAKAPRKRKRTESRPASSEMAAAIGRGIQVVRTDRGWSRKELAARTGLSYSFLSEIENGVKLASSRTFAVIADALDVAPGALFYDAERRLTEVSSSSGDEKPAIVEEEGRYLSREFPSPGATRATAPTTPGGKPDPRIERSPRVLDWLAGPLGRRSSSGSEDLAATEAPHPRLRRRRRARPGAADSGDQTAAPELENKLANMRSVEQENGSAEPDISARSVEQFIGALLPLLGDLSPEDRELVLDLAHRLAQRESGP